MSKHNRDYKNYSRPTKLSSGSVKQQENIEPVENLATEIKTEEINPVVVSAAEDKVFVETPKVDKPERVNDDVIVDADKPKGLVVKRTSHNVYLRSRMDTHHSSKLGVVKKGTIIDVISMPNAKWYQVETELGEKGYIMADFAEDLV